MDYGDIINILISDIPKNDNGCKKYILIRYIRVGEDVIRHLNQDEDESRHINKNFVDGERFTITNFNNKTTLKWDRFMLKEGRVIQYTRDIEFVNCGGFINHNGGMWHIVNFGEVNIFNKWLTINLNYISKSFKELKERFDDNHKTRTKTDFWDDN